MAAAEPVALEMVQLFGVWRWVADPEVQKVLAQIRPYREDWLFRQAWVEAFGDLQNELEREVRRAQRDYRRGRDGR